jgi:iron(III) transport system ATP-binding protein
MNDSTSPDSRYLHVWAISKQYGAYTALNEITFEVARGEMVCLLGPSGCGKTTALRIVAGLEAHDSGRVYIGGREVSSLPVSKRNVGIVFQSYALFPNLTVTQNVAYGLTSKGLPKAQVSARVEELLHLVGLPGLGAKYPPQLSGGQQQRVALARSMALSPDVLLLDEPLSALDAQVRIHLRSEIKKLQRELGVTTILVTHDQEEALTMADRILLMERGRIVQDATPGELYDQPATPFAASFLGSMNFLPVRTRPEPGQVDMGGHRLCVPPDAVKGAVNGAGSLAIRPEDIVVEAPSPDPAPADANLLDARLLSIEFRGPLYRLALRLNGCPEDAPVAYADVSARLARRLDLREDSPVRVTLPPERLHLFAAEG